MNGVGPRNLRISRRDILQMTHRCTALAAWRLGQAGYGVCCLGAILMPDLPDPDFASHGYTAALLVMGALALLGGSAAYRIGQGVEVPRGESSR